MKSSWLVLSVALAGCAVDGLDELDGVELSEEEQAVAASNRLASNRLASNRLASNRLASNSLGAAALTSSALIETSDGREVFSYIVKCALPANKSVSVADSSGVSYKFTGEIGLAPNWATKTPTVAERRWVTACLLARTNYYGVPVQISMRGAHDALSATPAETSLFHVSEGAFYGDLFDTTEQTWFACGSKRYTSALAADAQRTCTISPDGVTTMCGFTYTHFCGTAYDSTHPAACGNNKTPWTTCNGGGASWSEVITIFLPN
jgi:hypothetical protein